MLNKKLNSIAAEA